MRLLVDDRWIGDHGVGRFAREIIARLPVHARIPQGLGPAHPIDPFWTSLHLAQRCGDVYFEPGYNAPLASAVPFVFTIHDLIHLKDVRETSFAKRLYYRRIVRPAARRAYRVLTVSQYSKREIADWAGIPSGNVTVVGAGVSRGFTVGGDRFTLDRPYLLYVGSRKPHKNLPALLRAFASSGCARSTALLLSGPEDTQTYEWVRAAGLDAAQVRFAGAVAESRLPAVYRGASALVMPSLDEGFGLPALEAMACGTPVLAGERGALPEVVGDAAVLVDPAALDSIVEGLQRVVGDQELRRELVERGVARAAAFRWEDSAKVVLEVLHAAAANRGYSAGR